MIYRTSTENSSPECELKNCIICIVFFCTKLHPTVNNKYVQIKNLFSWISPHFFILFQNKRHHHSTTTTDQKLFKQIRQQRMQNTPKNLYICNTRGVKVILLLLFYIYFVIPFPFMVHYVTQKNGK